MNCKKCKEPLAYYESIMCIKCISDENHGNVNIDILRLIMKAKKINVDLWRSGHSPEVIIDNAKILEMYYGTE